MSNARLTRRPRDRRSADSGDCLAAPSASAAAFWAASRPWLGPPRLPPGSAGDPFAALPSVADPGQAGAAVARRPPLAKGLAVLHRVAGRRSPRAAIARAP